MKKCENEIVVYQPDETVRVETRYAHESIWLSQQKIAKLFGVQKAAVSKHLKNIFATGELRREATVSKMETVQKEGGRLIARSLEFYNLDAIIAVGYRVNSIRATQFRIWATGVLRQFCCADMRSGRKWRSWKSGWSGGWRVTTGGSKRWRGRWISS